MSKDIRNQHGAICWGELCTSDLEGAQKFYQKVLGWTFEATKSCNGGSYIITKAGNEMVAGMMSLKDIPDLPPEVPPHWGLYMTVDCIDTALAEVEANGGSIIMPKTTLDCGSVFAFVRDPQGATLGLMQYPSECSCDQ
ncbi:MAG: VOC family protein [Opitutales bacterium]|nr:VOC family protein [Opitutales bacterium]